MKLIVPSLKRPSDSGLSGSQAHSGCRKKHITGTLSWTALAARVIGEVTPEKVEVVRSAMKIVEEELLNGQAFQYLPILHEDRVTAPHSQVEHVCQA